MEIHDKEMLAVIQALEIGTISWKVPTTKFEIWMDHKN